MTNVRYAVYDSKGNKVASFAHRYQAERLIPPDSHGEYKIIAETYTRV
ncbi:MAG TPA: hypothetical protein PKV98_04245 [Burkholderiaceae bacterium]|nr:hypothetical protein [Burkholderiaceae bacterium]